MDPLTCVLSRSSTTENIFETAAAFIHIFFTKLVTLPECNTGKPYAATARFRRTARPLYAMQLAHPGSLSATHPARSGPMLEHDDPDSSEYGHLTTPSGQYPVPAVDHQRMHLRRPNRLLKDH